MKIDIDYEAILNDIKDAIAESIESKGHSATGDGVDSLAVVMHEDYGAVVGNFYLKYLQTGTPPHNVPYDAIHEWAKSKGIISDDSKESRRISGAITTYIRQHGTKAYQNGGEDVWDSAVDKVLENIQKYIRIYG